MSGAAQQATAVGGGAFAEKSAAAPKPERRSARLPRARALAREYGFLLGSAVDVATLARACWLAERWGTPPRDVLIANGWLSERDYARALAASCGTDCITARDAAALAPAVPGASVREVLRSGLLRQVKGGRSRLVLAGSALPPARIRNSLAKMSRARIALGTRDDLRRALLRSLGGRVLRHACDGLASRFPGESAHSGMTRAQRACLGALTGLLGVGAIGAPALTLHALATAATIFFACVVVLRLTACIHLAQMPPASGSRRTLRIPERELPVYTVLVPLFREAAVLPALISALKRLDYPAAKLDIKLIFESVDNETYATARALDLPGHFDLIVVPDAQPRTKPKALNYALQFARGEFAVIYDAEDRPEPDQLRKAVARFRQGPPNLACLQARLNFYNAEENWLTRQFTLEYSALFDGLLPTLERLDLPIPLGGTSNHFRIAALRWLGAWDAYNVTEDADLGMRLYRHGYLCRMLDSTTHEEAVCRFLPWLRQRTRWLKGYLQTYFVHMRHPWRLWRELGARRFLGFQLMIGGVVFSALAHPLFYGLLGLEAALGGIFAMPATILHLHLWLLAIFNVLLGYAASMGLAWLAARRRKLRLGAHVPFMPAYWLMISLGGYRALLHLVRAPFHWEKTEHGISRQFRRQAAAS